MRGWVVRLSCCVLAHGWGGVGWPRDHSLWDQPMPPKSDPRFLCLDETYRYPCFPVLPRLDDDVCRLTPRLPAGPLDEPERAGVAPAAFALTEAAAPPVERAGLFRERLPDLGEMASGSFLRFRMAVRGPVRGALMTDDSLPPPPPPPPQIAAPRAAPSAEFGAEWVALVRRLAAKTRAALDDPRQAAPMYNLTGAGNTHVVGLRALKLTGARPRLSPASRSGRPQSPPSPAGVRAHAARSLAARTGPPLPSHLSQTSPRPLLATAAAPPPSHLPPSLRAGVAWPALKASSRGKARRGKGPQPLDFVPELAELIEGHVLPYVSRSAYGGRAAVPGRVVVARNVPTEEEAFWTGALLWRCSRWDVAPTPHHTDDAPARAPGTRLEALGSPPQPRAHCTSRGREVSLGDGLPQYERAPPVTSSRRPRPA